MKILFLTNNDVSAGLSDWLARDNELIVWSDKLDAATLREIGPDHVVSYSYRHLISRQTLDALPQKFTNLHISLLPYNRGADPNFWSIVERTPPGVTIHQISPGMDEGDVYVQAQVSFDLADHTLTTSYNFLQQRIQALFKEHWASISTGTMAVRPQIGEGTKHFAREFAALKDQLLGAEGWDVPLPLLLERYDRLVANQS